MAVVDLSTAQKIGNVNKLVLDPNTRQVLALEVKSGMLGKPEVVLVENVQSFGKDAVTIDNSSGMASRDEFPQIKDLPSLGDVTGSRIVSASGTVLGQIKDVVLTGDGRTITEYEYSAGGLGGLMGRTRSLPANDDQRYGGSILTVADEQVAAERAEEEAGTD